MKQAYRYLSILFILFFVVDTMRADGGDVLERIVRLPKTKGTVYSLLGNVSQQSGYMFIYDSKVIDNDAVVKIKGGERSIRQAVYDIVGDTGLEFLSLRRKRFIYNRIPFRSSLLTFPLPALCWIRRRVCPSLQLLLE